MREPLDTAGSDPRIRALDTLARRVEELISAFEGGPEPTTEQMQSAWANCANAFAEFRELHEAREGEPLPSEVRQRMEQVQKLHAVATSFVSRQGDELADELRKVQGVRGRLEGLARPAAKGGSCDLAG